MGSLYTAELKNNKLFSGCKRSAKLFHRYGSSYAVAEELTSAHDQKKALTLLNRYLTGSGKMSHTCRTFQNFSFFVDESLAPFWNKDGILSFYGYGQVQYCSREYDCLMRYDLLDNTSMFSDFPCYLRIRNQKDCITNSPLIIYKGLVTDIDLPKTSDLYNFLQNKKISLNAVFAFKETQKRYSYFGESIEDVVVIEIIKEK